MHDADAAAISLPTRDPAVEQHLRPREHQPQVATKLPIIYHSAYD